MAIFIEIRKFFQTSTSLGYYVIGDERTKPYHVIINIKEKKLGFYKSNQHNDLVHEFNLSNLEDDKMTFSALDMMLNTTRTAEVFIKIYKAYKKNEFPECLDYCA